MIATGSVFFDVNLPNATTWFYFSALLAVALFFKFTRLLSIRNADVVSLFLPMPGFLLLDPRTHTHFWGYLWLLAASGYFLFRCLFDLTLVRRPALSPNLSFAGLAWLAGTLFLSLIDVAVQRPNDTSEVRDRTPVPLEPVRRLGEKVILEQAHPELDRNVLEESVDVGVVRGLTILCHLSIVVALFLIGWRHFEDLHAGMAAAAFYLLLPYTFLLMPRTALGRWDHAWPMALMLWMVFCFRRPTLAGIFLGLATGTVFFPVLVFPLWLSFYARRGALRFGLAFLFSAVLTIGVAALILWLSGNWPHAPFFNWTLSTWLPWHKPDPGIHGLWQGASSHWAYRLPIFVVYLAFAGITAFWPAPKNLAHVIALTAALFLGIQFWYADQGGTYVLWYLPLLLLLAFRPNLSACQPQPPGPDWLARWGRRFLRLGRRFLLRLNPVRPTRPVSRLLS